MFVLITVINLIAVVMFLPGAISWAIPIVGSGKAPEYTAVAVLVLLLFGYGIATSATGMFFYLVKRKHTIGNALMSFSISSLFAPRILMLPNFGAQLHCLIFTVGYFWINAVIWSWVSSAKKQKTIESTGLD